MKKVILWSAAVILMIAGIGLAAYPFLSDYINSSQVRQDAVLYDEINEELDDSEYETMLANAHSYNNTLIGSSVVTDPFAEVFTYPDDYMKMLRLEGTDVMARITIPKINVDLPIYHGTSSEILNKGVGHLSSSSLPVGGVGTHCILTGHTGYSTLKLFSDVDQLEEGDVLFINVLNQKLAYRVYQKKIILPEETDDLQIDPEKDYVTLVTCYPFGVNTHRLLVMAERIDLDEGESLASTQTADESTWDLEYKKALFWGAMLLAAILIIFFTIRFIVKSAKKRRAKKLASLPAGKEVEDGPPGEAPK